MSDKIRSLAGRFNRSVTALLSAKRCRAQLPMTVSLCAQTAARSSKNSTPPAIVEGFTQDLGQGEIAFIISVIRIDEHYLAGHDEKLSIEIALPNGKQIQMRVAAARYERIERKLAVYDYLVAARITWMSETDRETYEDFLKNADKFVQPASKKADAAKQTLVNQFFGLF